MRPENETRKSVPGMSYTLRCAKCNVPLDIEEDIDGVCPECSSKEEKRQRKFHLDPRPKNVKSTRSESLRKMGGESQWNGSQQ